MRGSVRVLGWLLLAIALPALRADDRTQQLLDRLAKEAEAFERIAPQVMGVETLHQRALVPPSRFKVRVGKAAEESPTATWQEREIISQYGFTVFGLGAIQELRQVMAVNGKRIANEKKAEADLAALVTGNNQVRKRRALQQMQTYGLRGGATDFGQILLLFSRANAERYEMSYQGPRTEGGNAVDVFHYKQIDGPQAFTLFRQDHGDVTRQLSVEGEIWMRKSDGAPVRITLVAIDTNGEKTVREEAAVDYARSEFGAMLPVETHHKETQSGDLVAENQFTYAGFHRFEMAR